MSIKNSIKILINNKTIKIVALICIVWFFFILPTYAQGTTEGSALDETQKFLETLISLCSRWWIILAILAGKLMTNEFVYGAFIHMDIYLWKIWNIMKNFANFALVGMLLLAIIQNIIGQKAFDIKKTIKNTLLAGILIQASWFMMGALIDVSTVATAAISAFPMNFLQNDIQLQEAIGDSVMEFKKLEITYDMNDSNNFITTQPGAWSPSIDQATRENILPNQNSVSWPFIYLGMSVFKFQKYLSTSTTTDFTNLTLGFILRFFLLFFFTVGLLLLLIANIMRVWLLRIFIIWWPFLILIQVFDKKIGDWWWWLGKIFNLSNLLAIAFKPVIFVAGISLMLIVIVSMQNSIMWSSATRENNLNGVSLSVTWESTSILDVKEITTISVNQKDILGANVIWPDALGKAQNFFSHLIMLLLTLFLMRRFIKLSLTIGWWVIEKTMEWLISKAEDIAKSAPVLPFKGGSTSLNAMTSFANKQTENMLSKWLGMNTKWKFVDAEEAFQSKVNNRMWIQDEWKEKDYITLNKLANSETAADYTNFFAKSQELAKERNGWISISNNTRWMNDVQTLLSNNTKRKKINEWRRYRFGEWGTTDNKPDTLESYFKKSGNAQALYEIMGWYKAAGWKATPNNYDELKKITFYPGGE